MFDYRDIDSLTATEAGVRACGAHNQRVWDTKMAQILFPRRLFEGVPGIMLAHTLQFFQPRRLK